MPRRLRLNRDGPDSQIKFKPTQGQTRPISVEALVIYLIVLTAWWLRVLGLSLSAW